MKKKENDIKEMNKKKNHKSFWKRFNEKWLWANISGFIVGIILFWWLFFISIISLMTAIFLTILNLLIIPLMYYFFKYFRESKHQTFIIKIVWIGCGGIGFGVIIWFIIGFFLITAPWAPLQALPSVLRGRILLLLLPTSCGIVGYMMYSIGKKREWRFPSHLIN